MLLKYKNYIIEDDRNGYILRQFLIKGKGDNIGDEYESDTIYPSTLDKAILHIIKREKLKIVDQKELNDYLESYKQITEELFTNLKI